MSEPSILPSSSTDLEREIAEACRLNVSPSSIRDVWNPLTCPAHILPWLAWAWSVDHWDSTWAEEQKRYVVADAVYIHRHKGTLGAVKRALSTLGYRAEVSEWFEYDGNPYTFRVVFDNFFENDVAYTQFIRLINSAKNVRSVLELLQQQRDLSGRMVMSTAVHSANVTKVSLASPMPNVVPYNARTGITIHSATVSSIALPDRGIDAEAFRLNASAAIQTARITTIKEVQNG